MKTMLIATCVMLGAIVQPGSASGQALLASPATAAVMFDDPPGSYRQSCRDIRIHGNRMRAKCQTTSGPWIEAGLDNFESCVGDINNVNGTLTCNKNYAFPAGDYSRTYRDIRMRYTTIYARCQNRTGQWVDTALENFTSCPSALTN